MPISQTTFEQRVRRINKGLTDDAKAKRRRSRPRRSVRERCLTFPFLVGISILVGGTGYAYVDTQPEVVHMVNSQLVVALSNLQGL